MLCGNGFVGDRGLRRTCTAAALRECACVCSCGRDRGKPWSWNAKIGSSSADNIPRYHGTEAVAAV